MGATLEFSNWIVPLLVTVVVFGLAAGSLRTRAPEYARLANRIVNLLLLALAAIASLAVWLAWAMVAR